MVEFASQAEVNQLNGKVNALENSVKTLEISVISGFAKINNTLLDISEQTHAIKHERGDMMQAVQDTRRDVREMSDGLLGNKYNKTGLFSQVAKFTSDMRNLEEIQFKHKERMDRYEQVEAFKEKVSKWKKGIFITLWIGFGGFLSGFAKAVATFIINLFI